MKPSGFNFSPASIAGGMAGGVVGGACGTVAGGVTQLLIPGQEGGRLARKVGTLTGAVTGGIAGGIVGNATNPTGIGAFEGATAGALCGGTVGCIGAACVSTGIRAIGVDVTFNNIARRIRSVSPEFMERLAFRARPHAVVIRRERSESPECICKSVDLKVFYFNAQSINPNNSEDSFRRKIDRIKQHILIFQPKVIAIVETWLINSHQDERVRQLLGLDASYVIFRQDRCDSNLDNAYLADDEIQKRDPHRGGGLLLAYRRTSNVTVERFPAEDLNDNIMNLDILYQFNCNKCCLGNRLRRFGLTLAYRRPGPYLDQSQQKFDRLDQVFLDRIAHIPYWYMDPRSNYKAFIIVGDFNWRKGHPNLDYIRLDHMIRIELQAPTHRNGQALDQLYSSNRRFVVNASALVTELLSDHSGLIFDINLANSDKSEHQICDYCDR